MRKLSTPLAETVSIALLLGVLAFAVIRPRGLPEAVAAVPAAMLVVALGAISLDRAGDEVRALWPVTAFLAAILVLAKLCADEGLFRAAGSLMASRTSGSPQRLLAYVFVLGATVTAVLSLDATVVLLTPVVFATATRLGVRPRPHLYACAHLANSGSLLLPVSNLTNLLAFSASGLTFVHFAGLMAVPWLAAVAAEYALIRRFFASDLTLRPTRTREYAAERLPVFAVSVVVATLLGFVVASLVGVDPAWVAAAGALVLAVRNLLGRRTTVRELGSALSIPFLLFVLALGVIVSAVVINGLDDAVRRLIPSGSSLPALLAIAFVAVVLANLINNLPAALVLIPLVSGPGAVLAVLLGVNIGPNLTYAGSLATLLWRRVLHAHDAQPSLGEFTALGAIGVPVAVLASVVGLWAGLQVIGG